MEEKPKEDISPEACVKAGKCMMKELMDKMPSAEEYKNMPSEEKDKVDEKEVLKEDE